MADHDNFHEAFTQALTGDTSSLSPWILGDPECAVGLNVYRNTVKRGAIDALAATYTTVLAMVGDKWFSAAASVYADARRPSTPSLLDYGADFPDWLANFPPASELPYLPAVALLDRLWWESYFAADGDHICAGVLADLGEDDLTRVALGLHPSVRLAAFSQNFVSLWLEQRAPGGLLAGFEIIDRAEFALIVRDGLSVSARLIDYATFALLVACRDGARLMTAAERALEVAPDAALPDSIHTSFDAGVFSIVQYLDMGSIT